MANTSAIIGATGGIGSEVATLLNKSGFKTHLIARDSEKLANLGNNLNSPFTSIDASDFNSLEEVLKGIDGLDSVINCAGSVLLKPAHLTSQQEFNETIRTNLSTAFSTVRAAAKSIKSGGSVILCSTAAVRLGISNHEAIAAAKGGVEGLVRAAAATYASSGLRVNAVAPGLTKTGMTEKITNNPAALNHSVKMHALGRIGEASDVASAICWLHSASWVTGQVIGVDGGLSSVLSKN